MVFVLLFTATALMALKLFRKFSDGDLHRRNREPAGFIFGAVSLIYSLILAFVIITVWEDYEKLDSNINKESDALFSIINHASLLPDSLKTEVHGMVATYAEHVVNDEWRDEDVEFHTTAIPQLRKLALTYEPMNNMEARIMAKVNENLDEVGTLHRERLAHGHSHIPHLVWAALLLGSIIVIFFSFYLSGDDKQLQNRWVGLLSMLIGLCLYLVYMLDHPFNGGSGVSKEPFERVIEAAKK